MVKKWVRLKEIRYHCGNLSEATFPGRIFEQDLSKSAPKAAKKTRYSGNEDFIFSSSSCKRKAANSGQPHGFLICFVSSFIFKKVEIRIGLSYSESIKIYRRD